MSKKKVEKSIMIGENFYLWKRQINFFKWDRKRVLLSSCYFEL